MHEIKLRTVSNRGKEWADFALEVLDHIDRYTIPQYGDAPNDRVESDSIRTVKENMDRYVKRMGTNQRGPDDQLRDLKKLAHYACINSTKFKQKFTEDLQSNNITNINGIDNEAIEIFIAELRAGKICKLQIQYQKD